VIAWGKAFFSSRAVDAWCVATPLALIGASNFFELAVAATTSLFELNSGQRWRLSTIVIPNGRRRRQDVTPRPILPHARSADGLARSAT
jgi:hypothetical protein